MVGLGSMDGNAEFAEISGFISTIFTDFELV
uniref:Uncharacterized protein n=1 Tax=Nelumbo nucifera TaxID=4432 RepID=A0A822ZP52_NELNU|nr:TPA_asm: hypothetical protein HUJ06_016520 [Nelumbo nucifera]